MNGIAALCQIRNYSEFENGQYKPIKPREDETFDLEWASELETSSINFDKLFKFSALKSDKVPHVVQIYDKYAHINPFDISIPVQPLPQQGCVLDFALYKARTISQTLKNLQDLGKQGVNNNTLYKLIEEMKKLGSLTDVQIDDLGGSEKWFVNRFTGTANNPQTDGSRHAGPPPLKPMSQAAVSVEEAAPLILRAYLNYMCRI